MPIAVRETTLALWSDLASNTVLADAISRLDAGERAVLAATTTDQEPLEIFRIGIEATGRALAQHALLAHQTPYATPADFARGVRDCGIFSLVATRWYWELQASAYRTAPNDVFSTIGIVMASDASGYYHPSQYTSLKNVEARFYGTGKEIYDDIGPVDYLFRGLGTTGSTRGTATYLKQHNPRLEAIGVVSSREDFIPGIRSEAEMWEVGLFQSDLYAEIVPIDSGVAIDATLELVSRYGVLAGPTSGATYAAALDVLGRCASSADRPAKAVIIVCDRLETYLSYFRKRRPELFGRTRGRSARDLTPIEVTGTPEITPDDLDALDGHEVLKIDTRGSMAYRIGHVPGSINIRDDYLDDMLSQGLPFPASKKLIFICPVGDLSKRLAAFTRQAGYDAVSLAGGIVAWRDAGKPLESSPRR